MASSKFKKINDAFECGSCGKHVPAARSTCRNHCPFCLTSKHVDVFPGDRSHDCRGLMKCVGYENQKKKGLVLWFRCQVCQELKSNIAITDDPVQADDYDLILGLPGVVPPS